MSKKLVLFIAFTFIIISSYAQIEVLKIVGKNSSDYKIGFGASLKFAYPISDGDDITLEGGLHYFTEKDNTDYGIINVPVKAGYRYTLNRTGAGFYVEPQLGYNAYGINSYYGFNDYKNVDEKFHGVIVAGGFGFLTQPGSVKFDFGIRYESVIYNRKFLNTVSFRIAHNFSFAGRNDY
ncbi:MAG: hypothetical protein ACTHJ5_12275 [Ilyomonas sp.]